MLSFLTKHSYNFLITNRHKFYIYSNFQLHSGSYKKDERILTLMDTLNLSYKDARMLVVKNESLHKLKSNHLKSVTSVLSKFGVTREDIHKYPDILALSPSVLKGRAMVLEESGFTKIDAQILMRFLHIIKMKLSLLKAHGLLKPDNTKNIVAQFLSWVNSPSCNVEYFDDTSTSFMEAHTVAMKHYLTWRLQIPAEKLKSILKFCPLCRSLRLVEQSFDILERKYGFTAKDVLNNKYLIDCDPDNISKMLQDESTHSDELLKNIIRKEPKILLKDADDIDTIFRCIQEFEISPEAIEKCPEIFHLSPELVRQRLVQLSSFSEFNVLKYHPRVLNLVLSLRKTNSRLKYLQEINHDPTLELLCCRLNVFERFVRDGVPRRFGADLIHYFSKKFSKPISDVKTILNKHPFWTQVSLLSIDTTLNFLLQENFSRDDIFQNIHLLLYPKEKVEEELRKLNKQPEIVNGERFGIFVDNLTPGQRLTLCLYYIEREHHFTGNGVWCTTPGTHFNHVV